MGSQLYSGHHGAPTLSGIACGHHGDQTVWVWLCVAKSWAPEASHWLMSPCFCPFLPLQLSVPFSLQTPYYPVGGAFSTAPQPSSCAGNTSPCCPSTCSAPLHMATRSHHACLPTGLKLYWHSKWHSGMHALCPVCIFHESYLLNQPADSPEGH